MPGSTHRVRDDKPGGHGYVDMIKSIVVPCDTYYYMLAGETGFVCGDLLDLVYRTTEMLRCPALRLRLGQAARQYALTRRWDVALEPLYRSYGAAGLPAATPTIGAPAGAGV